MKSSLLILLLALPASAQSPMRAASANSTPSPLCPELAGLSRGQAEARLGSLQLRSQACEVESSAPPGQVVGQVPPAGQPVSGSVLLYLARPRSAPARAVPPHPVTPPADSRWPLFALAQIPLSFWAIQLWRGRRES